MRTSRRADVAPFLVMDLLARADERRRTHGDVLMLCAGQPSSPAPAPVLAAAREALTSSLLGYTPALGDLTLRSTIAEHHARTYAIDVTADDVVVTTGSSGGFTVLFLAAFDAGDTVVVTRPGYPAYRNTLRALGCEVLEIECGPDTRYQPTRAMLEALPEVPAGVIVTSPANPTGTVIDAAELAAIARWCDDHDCLLISDEIYHGVTYGRECASAWQTSRNAVVMGSASKYFSMTGWRLGWMLVPEHLRDPIDRLAGNMTICAPTPSQIAAVAAFGPEARAELDGHVARYAENRELLERRLPEWGVRCAAPMDGAFYAYLDVSHLTDDSLTWCTETLDRTGVALTPGVDFDVVAGGSTVRLSYAGDGAEIDEAIDRLAAM